MNVKERRERIADILAAKFDEARQVYPDARLVLVTYFASEERIFAEAKPRVYDKDGNESELGEVGEDLNRESVAQRLFPGKPTTRFSGTKDFVGATADLISSEVPPGTLTMVGIGITSRMVESGEDVHIFASQFAEPI